MAAWLIALISLQACSKSETRHAPPEPAAPVVHERVPELPEAAPTLSAELEQLLVAIAEGDRVESRAIYLGGVPSKQWEKYERLRDLATVPQLIWLTDDSSAVVRCYAFQALAARSPDHVLEVLLKHLDDDEQVRTQFGCIGSDERTGDYFVEAVTLGGAESTTYQLNASERERLDRRLLNDRSVKLRARSRTLRELKPTAGDYARVRQIASDDRDEDALRALAKYQKPADVGLIASFFADERRQRAALYAVREFPDDSFYPLLTKVFAQEWSKASFDSSTWRLCYQALARYPRQDTLALFERVSSVEDAFRRERLSRFLLLAITKFPNALFEPLKAKLVLGHEKDEKTDLDYDD